MRLQRPLVLGNLKPTRDIIRLARKGEALDFTNGVEIAKLPRELIDLAALKGYAPADSMCLGLHGRGSVLPHTDDVYGDAAIVWLVADTGTSALMVARGGKDGVLEMGVGDVCLFPSLEYHAWVSRSSWAMCVVDVSAKPRLQHPDYRLVKSSKQ